MGKRRKYDPPILPPQRPEQSLLKPPPSLKAGTWPIAFFHFFFFFFFLFFNFPILLPGNTPVTDLNFHTVCGVGNYSLVYVCSHKYSGMLLLQFYFF
jgi:hypothetical protein